MSLSIAKVLVVVLAGTQALQIKTGQWEKNWHEHARPEITAAVGEPNLDDFMSTCNYTDGHMELRHWQGRFGNNLQQLFTTILMAEKAGVTKLTLPGRFKSGMNEMFDMPSELDIKPRWEKCEFHTDSGGYDCKTHTYNRCKSTFADRLRVFKEYITPYLKEEITNACDGQDKETVVVHIRDGDTAMRSTGRKAQPPCKYYDDVISHGYDNSAFPKVLLIHGGGEPQNPCVAYLQGKYKDKIIEQKTGEGSLAQDMCEVMKAHNLGASFSSFATTLKMMNSNLDRYFFPAFLNELKPKQVERFTINYDLDIKDVCTVLPKAVRYQLPTGGKGIADQDTYFLSYPDELIRETC